MTRRHATTLALASTLMALVGLVGAPAQMLAGCSDDPPPPAVCRDIPDGGCPNAVGGCDDPSCTALYECTSTGTWKLSAQCPANDGAPAPPTIDASDDARDAPSVDSDVPGAAGGPGCEDLEAPDCSLAAATSCGHGCCGCDDVYVCQGGGWNLWGSCEGGALTPVTPPGR